MSSSDESSSSTNKVTSTTRVTATVQTRTVSSNHSSKPSSGSGATPRTHRHKSSQSRNSIIYAVAGDNNGSDGDLAKKGSGEVGKEGFEATYYSFPPLEKEWAMKFWGSKKGDGK